MFMDNFLEISIIANAFKGIKVGVGILILDVGITMIKKMQKERIWNFRRPLNAEDINALWLAFFFTGKRKPVEIIAAELQNRPMLSMRDAKNKKGRLTNQEQLELQNYQANSAAAWSLRSHLPNHNLLFYYLEAMLERGEFADQTAASRIQKILTQTAAAAEQQK